jgi:GH25 family lysozyme M1 (1,4-beta-N-acetylmuramidase)
MKQVAKLRRNLLTGIVTTSLVLTFVKAFAFVPALTITPLPFYLYGRQSVVLQGTASQMCKAHPVAISRKYGQSWRALGLATIDASRNWRLTIRVPNIATSIVFKATCGAQYSASIVRRVNRTVPITYSGPGQRILGLDISRWQHIPGKTIDFQTMADAGISFVIMKASDGYDSEDNIARKFVVDDARKAKAAGMMVGYYHMISVPTGNSTPVLIASANRQATLVNTRLTELGGYDVRTLPIAVDVEGVNSNINQSSLELWTRTFVTSLTKKSGRTPILYSYRSLLATRYSKSQTNRDFLRTMHLWLAQPGNPADPNVRVGQFRPNDGSCFHTAWATAECKTVWTLWQYTSRGNRDTYGIPWMPVPGKTCPSHAKYCFPGRGTGPLHLDMNVFAGTAVELEQLAAGTWMRQPSDYLDPTPTPSDVASSSPVPSPSASSQ